jgi:glycerol kinase
VVNNLLMQFQADMLARPVVRPATKETTALGAAYAAGLATGWIKSTDEVRAHWQAEQSWEPMLSHERREEMYRAWKKAVGRSFNWLETEA